MKSRKRKKTLREKNESLLLNYIDIQTRQILIKEILRLDDNEDRIKHPKKHEKKEK